MRGILNKLTPEKFQKLSDDLLGLELDSDKVLKGVILLIFEKALDEPKYSSMYAQLCKRLSEEAPNFEPPGQPCTFKLLLLNKCRTEFENRAQVGTAIRTSRAHYTHHYASHVHRTLGALLDPHSSHFLLISFDRRSPLSKTKRCCRKRRKSDTLQNARC